MTLKKIVHIPDPGVSAEGELSRLKHPFNRSTHKFMVIRDGQGDLILLIGPISTHGVHKHCAHEHILKRAGLMGYSGGSSGGGSLVWIEGILSFGGSSSDYGPFDYGLLSDADKQMISRELVPEGWDVEYGEEE